MPGTFSGINMTSGALALFQRSLETTGHNIANVNTKGYSRQTTEFKTLGAIPYYYNGWVQLGAGAGLSAISRARDMYLEANSRDNAGNLGKFQTLASSLKTIEGAFNEPGESGIAFALDRFFDSWSALSSNPNDAASRVQVQSAGSLLTSRVRGTYNQLLAYESQLNSTTKTTISQINQLAEKISTLNKEIRQTSALGGSANDLMDQRDAAVRELSGLIDTKVETFEDGSYAVYVANFPIVDSVGARQIPATYDATAGTFNVNGNTYTVRNGKLGGLFQSLAQVDTQKTQLDTLADELREQFNTLHTTGIDQDGNTGIAFFNDAVPRTGAIDFDLSAEVKGSPRSIAAGLTGEPGDGGLALTFSQLRDQSLATLGNQTFHGYYTANVGDVATQAAYYDNAAQTEIAVGQQIESQVQAVSGVSIDDEMADMMRFQRSYQAAARALTVFDQVAEDLIGMLRR